MDEIINYVMDTPGNTNPNVLRGMLENNSSGGDFKSIEVWRGEEFEWTQGKGNDWHSPCSINFNDFSSDEYYLVKIFPYMNEPINIFKNSNNGLSTRSIENSVQFGLGRTGQMVAIQPFESTPEVEAIVISKIVPISYQESEQVEPSSMEEAP